MNRCVVYLLLFALGASLPVAAQSIDSKKLVVGVFVGATRVEEHREIIYDSRKGPVDSALNDLIKSGDEYLISVRIGDKTYTGRFFEPLPARGNSGSPKNWRLKSPVTARFKKGGKTKVRMYVRRQGGKEIPTELMSIIGPDGREHCAGRPDRRNCAVGWTNP